MRHTLPSSHHGTALFSRLFLCAFLFSWTMAFAQDDANTTESLVVELDAPQTTDTIVIDLDAPPPTFDTTDTVKVKAPVGPPTDPTSALAQAFGDQIDFRYGKVTSSRSDDSTGPLRWVFRNNFRLYSSNMTIKCETFVYEQQDGKTTIRATPAVGKRVELVYAGMRASCGLLEHYPDENITILLRHPVIYQTDAQGREFETSGHKITMSQNQDKQARVIIDSRKNDLQEMPLREPAVLIVDSATKEIEPQGMDLEALKLGGGGKKNLKTLEDMVSIPVDERSEEAKRP